MPLLELFRPERPKPISSTANSYTSKCCDFPSYIALLYLPADRISSRVKKIKSKSTASTLYANYLLTIILSADDLLMICPYSTYISKGLDLYKVSKVDLSRYTEYV
jgi:hypothetical protein